LTTAGSRRILSRPESIAVDSRGNIYASDVDNSRLVQFSSAGTLVRQISLYADNSESAAIDKQGEYLRGPAGRDQILSHGKAAEELAVRQPVVAVPALTVLRASRLVGCSRPGKVLAIQ
jgi:NHL repeat-containing protein